MLDFIGDLGGLLDGLKYACAIFIAPLSTFSMNSLVLTTIFRHRKRDIDNEMANMSTNLHGRKIPSKDDSKYVHDRYFIDAIKNDINLR